MTVRRRFVVATAAAYLLVSLVWLAATQSPDAAVNAFAALGAIGVAFLKAPDPPSDTASRETSAYAVQPTARQDRQSGRGGDAIHAGRVDSLAVENRGTMRGGRGGGLGDGGHAIHVDEGANVTIENYGVIAGGDAGRAVPVYTEKIVRISFPADTGLNAKLDAEGRELAWCNESRVEQLLREGWSLYVSRDESGRPIRYRVKNRVSEDQLLIVRGR